MTADKSPAKPGKDVVYVDLDDEITSIIDKVENAKDKVVALVLPKRAAVLQSIVNMRLLKRAADNAGKDVVLISSESALSPLAGAAGLHVAKNLTSKPHIPPSPIPIHEGPGQPAVTMKETADDQEEEIDETNAKIDYGRSIGELAASREVEEPETIPLNDEEKVDEKTGDAVGSTKTKTPKDKRLKVPNFDKFRLSLGLGIAGLILLIIFIILANTVLPKATITIKTTSLPVSANFNLTADGSAKTLDEDKGIIPASLQTKDQTASQTVTATGQQNNGDKASGSVTMSAQDCSTPFSTPADVPAGTGLSSNSLTYITQAKTSFSISGAAGNCVNYAATSPTAIKAQTGGSKYNVSGASFSVSGRSDVSASGSASGGTDNIATVLSQADVDGAKQKITSADTDKFTKDWQKALSDQGLYVIASTLKLSDPAVTSSTPVGQPATSATVTIKITYSLLSVKNDDLKKVVTDQMSKQIDTKKQKLSSDDVLKGLTVSVSSQESPTKAILALSEDTTAVPILDTIGIKKTAAGQKTGDIQAALSNLPGVKEVSVKLSPFWVSKAPKASKISVIQQQVSSGNTSP
jgi:hypothetical protein